MNRTNSRIFALLIGTFLLIEGIWGEFSNVVFGVLTTNQIHATIHILLGIIGLWTGIKGGARNFLIFLGILLAAVGVMWFIPGLNNLVVGLLNVNQAVALFNIVVGLVALVIAFTTTQQTTENKPSQFNPSHR